MKTFLMIMAMFTLLVGCQQNTGEYSELLDEIQTMDNNSYKDFSQEEYKDFLSKLPSYGRIELGRKTFEAVDKDELDSTYYVFACNEYSITFNMKSDLHKGNFSIQKTWSDDQDKYHHFMPYWFVEGLDFIERNFVLLLLLFFIASNVVLFVKKKKTDKIIKELKEKSKT